MVRFQCCFYVNIIIVIQFVLKVFCSFSLSTVVMAKFMSSICVDLGAHSFFPTPHPFKIYLCLVTMAFARRLLDEWWNMLHQTNESQAEELDNTLVSFFMEIVCRHPLEQGGIENQDFKNVLPWEPLQLLQPQGAHTICLCSRLLFYSKCTGFTVCFTYSDINEFEFASKAVFWGKRTTIHHR